MAGPRDLEFLYEIGTLRNMPRGWRQHLGTDCASVLEHTVRVVWLALAIAKREGNMDESKVMRMALVHDITESRTSDHSYVQKVYVKADENRAADDIFANTSLAEYRGILQEYDSRESLEAKIVKDADNLDVDLELKELEERGLQLPKKWEAVRRKVRDEKLYTEGAKKIWDEIQESDPADWHLASNKWEKIPEAGT